ncbi:hypothetical protein AGMMS49543_08190 [Betaproteobacteria bacterium]|nr:hypothetical protein AGMMS49543_08190 [Betaproteobacteria bacterium]GHU18178.1 hypothetical protein AGMMS50243_07730 [Betaproteobacteria bacterium]
MKKILLSVAVVGALAFSGYVLPAPTGDINAQVVTPELELHGGVYFIYQVVMDGARQSVRDRAIEQNIKTLHKRANELGVVEPAIQRRGADRIVVQLPGVEDADLARKILGSNAILEIHRVDDDIRVSDKVPADVAIYTESDGSQILVKKRAEFTSEHLTDAQDFFDAYGAPVVGITLDSTGKRILCELTRKNIGKRIAILLVENGKSELVAPIIRTEICSGHVAIPGNMSTTEAKTIALLLRSGTLAAPIKIIEERSAAPSGKAQGTK